MPKRSTYFHHKIPKGAKSLGDVARMRGRGGSYLKHVRKSPAGLDAPSILSSKQTRIHRAVKTIVNKPDQGPTPDARKAPLKHSVARGSIVSRAGDVSMLQQKEAPTKRIDKVQIFQKGEFAARSRVRSGSPVRGGGTLGVLAIPSQAGEYKKFRNRKKTLRHKAAEKRGGKRM